jgi:hypothetical protein
MKELLKTPRVSATDHDDYIEVELRGELFRITSRSMKKRIRTRYNNGGQYFDLDMTLLFYEAAIFVMMPEQLYHILNREHNEGQELGRRLARQQIRDLIMKE